MEPSCPLGTTRCIPQAKFTRKPYNKSFIDQVCSAKIAGYWPRSFFASLFSSRSINTQKKNLANIQPSWPHTWSITHTYYPFFAFYPLQQLCMHVWIIRSWDIIGRSCSSGDQNSTQLPYPALLAALVILMDVPSGTQWYTLSTKERIITK